MHPQRDRPSSRWISPIELPGGGNFRYRAMATTSFTSPKINDRLAQLSENLLAHAVAPHPTAKQRRTVGAAVVLRQDKPMSHSWRVDLATLFHSLLEPEVAESPLPSAVAANSEGEAFLERPMEAAHEAILAISSPFHWEPKPAWINIPGHSTPEFLNPADPQRFVPMPKIPIRPLHKQPFYRRFYFYLSRWLGRSM